MTEVRSGVLTVRAYHGSELHHLRGGEPERVERGLEHLLALLALPQLAHDARLHGATAVVDQHQLDVGGAVHGHQVADEDLVGGVRVQDLEDHVEGIADDGRLGVNAVVVLDLDVVL